MNRLLVALALLGCLGLCVPQLAAAASPESHRCYPETGFTVSGRFLEYFDAHGGLDIFGLPLTAEVSAGGYSAQYFERARFEFHPEDAGTDHEVLLGLVGVEYLDGRQFLATIPFASTEQAIYFPETGHSLSNGFLYYWQSHGGLYQFGYPLSEEIQETSPTDGVRRAVQYFQRARFEYHPDLAGTPYEVSLGHLGRQLLEAKGQSAARVSDQLQTLEQEMLRLINADRAAVGVPPLRYDSGLASSARQHVLDMIEHDVYSHTGTDGSSPQDRMRRAGVVFGWSGECWGVNSKSDRYAALRELQRMMISEPNDPNVINHRWILTSTKFTRVGIGIGIHANGQLFLVEDFADG
jgi:uncharacterized protein YkwD